MGLVAPKGQDQSLQRRIQWNVASWSLYNAKSV